MAISFPISLPASPEPAFIEWEFVGGTAVGESPFNAASQKQENAYDRLRCSVRYPPMDRATAAPLLAALNSLYGRSGTFLFGPVGDEKTARGIATGTPLVNGAHAAGAKTLVTDGWTAAQTGILKAGDWFQLGSGATARLHQNLEDENSDGGGAATLEIRTALIYAVADNAAIVVASPKGVFRLLSNPTKFEMNLGNIYSIVFDAEQDSP